MSADNKAHVRSIIEEGWNDKNPATFDERIATEFVCHTPGRDYEGPAGYKQLYDTYVTAFPDCRFTIDEIVAEGDKVSLSYTFAGTHTGPLQDLPPTGNQVSVAGISVSRIVEGRSVEENVVWDTLGLLQQLGVAQ